jgi:hypothetical protein
MIVVRSAPTPTSSMDLPSSPHPHVAGTAVSEVRSPVPGPPGSSVFVEPGHDRISPCRVTCPKVPRHVPWPTWR